MPPPPALKKGEIIMREQFMIAANLCVCKSEKHDNQRYKSNKFQYIPLFENGF